MLCLASVGLLIPDVEVPSIRAPGAVVIVLPFLVSRVAGTAALVLWPLALPLWAPALLRGARKPPYRTLVAWGAVTALSLLYFGKSWRFGLEYQGATFTWGCLGISLALAGGAGLLLLSCVRRPSFGRNLAAHWLLVAWLVTYAFPYLGETP